MSIEFQKIETQNAPTAIGPYSQAVKVKISEGKLVFVSGQLPIDPKSGKLISGNISMMTKQVFSNIEAILKASGTDFSEVVRVDVFLKDMNDFGEMNEVYKQYLNTQPYPARQTIQAGQLPLDAPIEISCIAVSGK